MILEQIASIASIIASAAVVISLIFIGLQLRQNAHLTRMAAAQTSAMLLSENYGRVVEDPSLAELLTRSEIKSIDDFSRADRLRLSNFLSISFRHYEVLHIHRRYGIFEEELWLGSKTRLQATLQSPTIRQWWDSTRHVYSKSFVGFVDELCAQCEAEEPATLPQPS
jgi:hypothetical protein